MAKRIFAIIGIILIVGLYITTLVLAITSSADTIKLFYAAIIATIAVPIILYALQMLHRLQNRDN